MKIGVNLTSEDRPFVFICGYRLRHLEALAICDLSAVQPMLAAPSGH